ncbi:hypothetical protein LOK49_LG06G00980 [Camellia lanceoleosa]|uniref:Uncharacterized protein n=1 Tax=Camellia lanceoleosa TaxID=1840588 RepID=A0ACC0HAC5_9ERIC|nr:hypothetical protein LOK49_LG06G00980 [Camellia lanceoleosa]
MCSRQTSSIFRKSPSFLYNSDRNLRDSMRFRCVLDQIVPKFAVSSSELCVSDEERDRRLGGVARFGHDSCGGDRFGDCVEGLSFY